MDWLFSEMRFVYDIADDKQKNTMIKQLRSKLIAFADHRNLPLDPKGILKPQEAPAAVRMWPTSSLTEPDLYEVVENI